MKNNKIILIIIGISLLLFFGFWNLKQQNQNTPIQNEKVVQEFKANLVIADEGSNPTFDISQYIGRTVLEATRSVLNGNIKTTGENEKAFVTNINGRNADTKKHEFWELLVNGKQTEVGAGTLKIQNGDNVVWKISTY